MNTSAGHAWSRPSITSARDAVYEELRHRIISGLEPGTMLRLDALAKELGVSTMPIREALSRLGVDGLVVIEPRRGAVVASISLKDLTQIQLLRATLSGLAIQLGVPNLREADDSAISELHARMQKTAVIEDAQERLDAHIHVSRAMQDVVFRAAEHPRLMELIESNRRASERYVRFALRSLGGFEADLSIDKEFAAALKSRDAFRAESVLRRALLWTIERTQEAFPGEGLTEAERRFFQLAHVSAKGIDVE